MAKWKKVILSGSIAQLANETFISGHITASGIVKAEHLFSTDDAEITDDLVVGGDIDLEGSIDVNGTANLDIVDIDGAVNMASTALVTGVLTTTAAQVSNGGIQVATDKKVQFRDAGITLYSSTDGQLDIAADGEVQIATTLVDLNGNLDVSGTALVTGVLTSTAIQVVNGGLALATDKKIQFRDSAVYINSDADSQLQFVADGAIAFKIGSTDQIQISDGVFSPLTTNDVDLGKSSHKFKDLYLTGDITASGHTHIVGDITSSATIKSLHSLIEEQLIVEGNIDLEGSIDVNGTANLDVVDIDGAVDMASTALVTGVLTTTAIQVVNGGLALATDKKIQFRDSAVYINSDADGSLESVADTSITFKIGSTEQLSITDGLLAPTTTNDVDLGSTTKKFKNLFLTGDVTASGHMHVVGDITSSANVIGVTGSFGHITGSFAGDGTLLTGVTIDIDGLSAGTALHQTQDHFVYTDNGTEKKITFSDVEDAIFANIDGDATVAAGGALTIGDSTVETGMIVNDAVTADKLASNAVVNASVASGAAIAFTKLAALTDGNILVGNAGNQATSTTVSGDVTINGAGVVTIGAEKVVNSMIGDGAVDTEEIADDAITAAKLASNAVVNASIASNAAIAHSKLAALASTKVLVGNGSNVATEVALSGDVTMANNGAVTLGTVGANHIDEISNLTAGEGAQLENIDSVTISNDQWGYLGALDQAVQTNSDVQFADVQIDGNLVVAGTASFTNTTNLEIKDRFISLASGSTSVGDGGIVVNHYGGTYPSGSAFGYEGGTANRWAVQNEFAPTGSTFAPDAYMGIVTFSTSVPSGNPAYGGANYGYGNIHVETDTGDVFIFA